jgi:hypothetical protein
MHKGQFVNTGQYTKDNVCKKDNAYTQDNICTKDNV